MSVFSDGSLDITTEGGLQERLEMGISPESRATIEKILASVSRLSNIEKLFLYLKLPTYVPVVNTTAERTKTSSETESLAVTWTKTHLARNAKTSLLQQKVYDDYRLFCEAHQHQSVPISDFKKILLSVFPDLTTRRLGSRGNAKHMFGGISYLMQPGTFTVPKIKVEDDNKAAAFCDDPVDRTKDGSKRRVEDWTNRAASRLILEWAYKLLSIPFESIQDLAVHLISKSYVSQVSEEAFTVAAGTNCQPNCIDSPEEVAVEDTAQKQLQARHQLQRKLQERREITRQKQRMEEERTHLSTLESASTKSIPLSQTTRNALPGVSRTPGPRLDPDRVPRRPSVPTILPKKLLPKLRPEARFGFDPQAARSVDSHHFILLSPGGSHLQPGHAAGSLVFISTSLAQSVPAPVVKSVESTRSAQKRAVVMPTWSDLAVMSTNPSVAVPIVTAGGCNNPAQGVPGSAYRNGNAEVVVNGPVCLDVVRQGNQSGNGSLTADTSKPVVSQEARSLALAAVGTGLAPSGQGTTIEVGAMSCVSSSYSFQDDGYARISDNNSAPQCSSSPPISRTELQTQPVPRTSNPSSQGSKGRGRNATPSRSSTKTVSSILDEQRCSAPGAVRAMRFYNDSRNVSQILKELREKGVSSADCEQGQGVSAVLDLDRGTPNSFVYNPVVGLAPQTSFQFVQVLNPQSDFDKIAQPGVGSSLDGDLQSLVGCPPPGLLSEVLLSPESVVRLVQPTELALPSLVGSVVPKAGPAFEAPQPGSVYGFFDPINDQTFGKGGSGEKKTVPDTRGGKFLCVAVSASGVGPGDSSTGSRRPITFVEGLKHLGVPVVMSTSESQTSSCVGLQQILFKSVESASVAKTCSMSSVLPSQRSISLSEDNRGAKLGQVGVSGSSVISRTRLPVKRSLGSAQNYCGIKRLLLGDDRPADLVETGKEDLLMSRLHSPGADDSLAMPYKDHNVQHCTLQQLSQVSTLRMLEQARLRQLAESKSQSKSGSSRPASAFGDDKTGGLVWQGSQRSRPNTVASGAMFGGTHADPSDYPDAASYDGSRDRSSPMSGGLSPRSNLSACSLYLDQTNAFMPIHITDSLPSVAAIKPLPTLGQRHRVEIDGFGVNSRPADARGLATAFTSDARGFVPYASSDGVRVATSCAARSGGFAPVSSIRPVKKGSHGGAGIPSRQRHHSAHDFQATLPQGACVHEVYDGVGVQPCATSGSSAFGGASSSGLGLGFDFHDLETAGEVAEIISASLESSVGGAALTALQRSRSEPANCLQGGCAFDLDEVIHMLSNAVADSSTTAGRPENLLPHGSQVDWSECSDRGRIVGAPQKLPDAQDPWSSSSRDRLISGVELRSFSSEEYDGPFERSATGGAYIDGGCTPPLSQNSSPEFASDMPLFDKPDKEMGEFPPDGGPATALDTPSSLEGLFGAICGDEGENHEGQSTGCGMDFTWPY